jgi:hypothetical protein
VQSTHATVAFTASIDAAEMAEFYRDVLEADEGGRGVYLLDPSGHYLELITQPYV